MVRKIVDFDEAQYERLERAAADRGQTVEQFIFTQAMQAAPAATVSEESVKPFKTWDEFFTWCDALKLNSHGWKWNREELYDRPILRRH